MVYFAVLYITIGTLLSAFICANKYVTPLDAVLIAVFWPLCLCSWLCTLAFQRLVRFFKRVKKNRDLQKYKDSKPPAYH